MKELETRNIVEFRNEGKNKTYTLKTSIEAAQYRHIFEHLNLMDTVTNHPVLRRIVERIQQEDSILMAILFGSYARGTPTPTSDIDLYIETDDKELKKKIVSLHSKLNVKIGPFNKENLLIKEIIKNHIIVKGVERYHELIHQDAR